MSNLISTSLIFLVICLVYSRSISKDALLLLSDEEKNNLAQQSAGFRRFSQIPIIIVFISYLIIKFLQPSISTVAFVLLILFFITFLFITSARIIKKMKESSLSEEYITKYKQSRLIYNSGFTACGVILLYELLK